jgi:hypothetical protein
MTYDFWQSFLTGAIEIVATYFFTLTLIAIVPYTFSQHAQRHGCPDDFPMEVTRLRDIPRGGKRSSQMEYRESDQHWHRP